MLEEIHTFIIQNNITSVIYSPIYNLIQEQLLKLKDGLSEETYESMIPMLDEISSIIGAILVVYIVYLILLFVYSLLIKRLLRTQLLISLLVSTIFLLAFLSIYAYININ